MSGAGVRGASRRRSKVGRRNHYTINPDRRFRYPTEADVPIGVLLDLFARHDRANQAPA